MQSTLTPQDTDPHDAFVIEPDVVLAARADHASSDPVREILSHLARQATYKGSEVSAGAPTPAVDTTFRATAVDSTVAVPGERPAKARWGRRTLIAFLFAFCSAVAAETWKHHSDAARQMISNWLPPLISNWVPPFVLASSPAAEKPPLAEQPDSAPAQVATADKAPAQPESPAQPTDSAAPAVASAAELASSTPSPSTQSMARDLATMGQQIEQLKASIEQLKASQAQMSRDMAKNSTPSQRPRVATLPPRPVVAPPRKPRPAYAPAPAIASTLPPLPPAAASPALPPPPVAQTVLSQPVPGLSQPAPMPQSSTQADGEPVVRPPMPLR
jgi:hypothetical protein